MRKRIKDLPQSTRPREKIEASGAQNLTDIELLAILLGTGRPKKNVLQLARGLLKHYPLSKLPHISISQLTTISGVGKSKATRIMAALELGSRLFAPPYLAKTVIQTTEDALKELKDIANKKQEHIVVLYLNARHQLIQREIVALGSLNSSLIEPKEIFYPAILNPTAAIILAHNHPSTDPTPSQEDVVFTKRVQVAGDILGIPLIDHLIVCTNNYFSFKKGAKSFIFLALLQLLISASLFRAWG